MTIIAQDAHLTAGAWAACGSTREKRDFVKQELNLTGKLTYEWVRLYCS